MNKLIYVAGKLTDGPEGYIHNMHRMIKYARQIEEFGVFTAIPCLDIIKGLVCGDLTLHDYMGTNLEIMFRCDAVALVPGWESSKGTRMEIEAAKKRGIPVLQGLRDIGLFCRSQHLSDCQKVQEEMKEKIERMRNE